MPTADLTFPGSGSAWSTPSLTRPVQRQVDAGMPVLARPRHPGPAAGPAPASFGTELPVVSRVQVPHAARTPTDAGVLPTVTAVAEPVRAEPSPVTERALTTSTDRDLPRLTLPTEPLAEPDTEPVVEGPDAAEQLVDLQAAPEATVPSRPATPDAPAVVRPDPPSEAVTGPVSVLPLAVQRSTAPSPGPPVTVVDVPGAGHPSSPATDSTPSGADAAAQRTTAVELSGDGSTVQRQAPTVAPGRSGQRLGLGAPLAPAAPLAPHAPTVPPLPVVQRSISTGAEAGRPGGARPTGPDLDPARDLAPVPTRQGPAPQVSMPNVQSATAYDSTEREPSHAAHVDTSDSAEPPPAEEGSAREGEAQRTVEPEAPPPPSALPLTLSRAVDPPPARPDALASVDTPTSPLPVSEPHGGQATWAAPLPAPTVARAVDLEDGGAVRDGIPAPVAEAREVVAPARVRGPEPTPLPLAVHEAARSAGAVVSRSPSADPAPPPPQPDDGPARSVQPFERAAQGATTAWPPSRPGLALPTVQRAAPTTVRPDPPPTLQRLPGLSSLPGMVRDRPASPSGTTRLPQALTHVPAGIPDSLVPLPSLTSLPAGLPPAPDAPGVPVTPSVAAPDPGGLPMPVATARALVAAVTGAGPTASGTPTPSDGIPPTSPPAAVPADETAENPAPVTGAASAGLPAFGSASSGTAPAPGAATTPQELDELARRLYDPLASRLRAELLLDRERRGLRTDAW